MTNSLKNKQKIKTERKNVILPNMTKWSEVEKYKNSLNYHCFCCYVKTLKFKIFFYGNWSEFEVVSDSKYQNTQKMDKFGYSQLV